MPNETAKARAEKLRLAGDETSSRIIEELLVADSALEEAVGRATALQLELTQLREDRDRLLRGEWLAEEVHGICHNLHGTVSAQEFADGCAAEQRRLYGCAPDRDRPALFRRGDFTLSSGRWSSFKIDCDALTDQDWLSLAYLVSERVGRFSAVEGVPEGGLRLAEYLQPLRWTEGPVLIVDDVLTTGGSLERQRAGREALGAVVFARGPCPAWVTPLFTLTEATP